MSSRANLLYTFFLSLCFFFFFLLLSQPSSPRVLSLELPSLVQPSFPHIDCSHSILHSHFSLPSSRHGLASFNIGAREDLLGLQYLHPHHANITIGCSAYLRTGPLVTAFDSHGPWVCPDPSHFSCGDPEVFLLPYLATAGSCGAFETFPSPGEQSGPGNFIDVACGYNMIKIARSCESRENSWTSVRERAVALVSKCSRGCP